MANQGNAVEKGARVCEIAHILGLTGTYLGGILCKVFGICIVSNPVGAIAVGLGTMVAVGVVANQFSAVPRPCRATSATSAQV
jgi:hypothetical protein